jgi:methylmalonyl-CoA mutase N-terminal domain/subunit
MSERFGATNPKALMLRFHVQTAGSTLTAQQPINNGIRVALQALAAALGGCNSLHTNSYDEALALPSQDAVTLALRTQQLIAFESGIADFVDPLGGSYAIEALTDRVEERAREYIEKIDEMGGVVPAIEQGYIQREIQDTAYAYQLAVESGDRTVVGVNKFTSEDSADVPLLRVDPAREAEQAARVQKVRETRDQTALDAALDRLETAARDDGAALFPCILDAVRVYGTVGEISDRLRGVFGEFQQVLTV